MENMLEPRLLHSILWMLKEQTHKKNSASVSKAESEKDETMQSLMHPINKTHISPSAVMRLGISSGSHPLVSAAGRARRVAFYQPSGSHHILPYF